MKRGMIIVLFAPVVAATLAGCGDFRQRAAEAETRIASAEEWAQVAEEAAGSNTGRLLELEQRVSDLEAALDEMRTVVLEEEDTP